MGDTGVSLTLGDPGMTHGEKMWGEPAGTDELERSPKNYVVKSASV